MSESVQPSGRLPAVFFLAALLAVGEISAVAQAPNVKRRARPPKFDPTILQLLGSDVPAWPRDPLPRWMDVAGRRGGSSFAPETSLTSSSGTALSTDAPADESAESGQFAWSTLADAATLEDEIKATALSLQQPLASASTFSSGGFRAARDAFLLLSRLFRIEAEHDGDGRWNAVAEEASGRFAAAANACTSSDQAAYAAAVAASEALQRLLRSSSLPPGESASGAVNDLGPLMRRMQSAEQDNLAPLLADERSFRDRTAVAHEAAVVALLAHDATSGDFEFGDDDAYAEYAGGLVDAAKSLGVAAERGEVNSAREAFSAMRQACDACHADYR